MWFAHDLLARHPIPESLPLQIARKVDTPLIFPMKCLDMSPFTSATVLRQRFSSRNGTTSKADTKKAVYELYAVISHRGKMEGGHYIAFIKVGR